MVGETTMTWEPETLGGSISYFPPHPPGELPVMKPWSAGEPVSFSSAGEAGGVPAFRLGVVAPEPPVLAFETEHFTRGAPFTFAWKGPASSVLLNGAGAPFPHIRCPVAPTARSFTFSAAFVAMLGDYANVNVANEATAGTQSDGWDIRLSLSGDDVGLLLPN
jgi:hypothetical protein